MSKSVDKAVEYVEKRIVGIDNAEPYLNILVYGRNKQGKTRFAASAPNVLIIDVNEKGTRSARKFKGAKVFRVNRWEDVTYAYWYLRAGNHPFQSVAIDTTTQLQAMCMKHVLGDAVDRDPNKDPAMASKREWGKLAELLKPMILNFRNLPMHTIFVAQERHIEDDDETGGEVVPDMSGANRGTLMASVDVIGRIYQKEVRTVDKRTKKERKRWETRMLVGPHDVYATGDRTGELGRIVSNPTVPAILEAAELTGEEDDG